MNNFIQNSIYNHNWVVPRSVMCTLFWTGVILVFTGMILLVTSKHKGKMYESWGGVLLGLGLCILLVCLILCIHAYCVMAADALDEEGNADHPADKSNPSFSDGRGSTAANLIQTPNTGGSSLVNGRKPRSIAAELIPPPKFGVNVTKPPTHTVRFFLSNGADETESVDADKTAAPQEAYPATPLPRPCTQTHNGGRKISSPPSTVVGQGRRSTVEPLDQGKTNGVELRTNSDVNSRSLDRNLISSDCDSVMSVETIIQRTLRREAIGGQTRSPTSSAYDFPDNDDDDDDQETTTNEVLRADREANEARSLPASARRIGKPFPVPSQSSHSSSSTARGGSQGKPLPVSGQTPRHSHAKSHQPQPQPQQPYSSDASLSPGSPEELTGENHPQVHDRVSSAAPARKSTARQMTIPVVKPTTPASHHHHNPEPMIGGLSITRSFGPSSVTVTPLGTAAAAHEAAAAGRAASGHRSHARSEGAYHRHPLLGSMPVQEEEGLVERSAMIRDAGTARKRSTKQEQKRWPIDDDDDDDDDDDHRRGYLTSNDLPLSNRYQQLPRPPSNPLLLEITESKATVYDNVQYFQM